MLLCGCAPWALGALPEFKQYVVLDPGRGNSADVDPGTSARCSVLHVQTLTPPPLPQMCSEGRAPSVGALEPPAIPSGALLDRTARHPVVTPYPISAGDQEFPLFPKTLLSSELPLKQSLLLCMASCSWPQTWPVGDAELMFWRVGCFSEV